MYADGEGVDKDEKRAVELFTITAEQGNAVAQYNLGVMYEHGRGVDKDEKRAAGAAVFSLWYCPAPHNVQSFVGNTNCLPATQKRQSLSVSCSIAVVAVSIRYLPFLVIPMEMDKFRTKNFIKWYVILIQVDLISIQPN